jgi:hypothetical protein
MKRGMAPGGMNPSATTVQYVPPHDDGEPQPEAVPANLQNMLSAMNMGPIMDQQTAPIQPPRQPPTAPRSYAVRHN